MCVPIFRSLRLAGLGEGGLKLPLVSLGLGVGQAGGKLALLLFKDRQQERKAVLTRSHLKALCDFAPYTLYVYHI